MTHQILRYTGIISLLVVVAFGQPSAARAADPPLPGFGDLGEGSTLSYAVSGLLEPGDQTITRLVVERLVLEPDAALPDSADAQLIAVESGSLTMTDELGLVANLGAGEQLVADAGAVPEISADQPTSLLRARLAEPEIDITIEDDACTPESLTASYLDGLTIKNSTRHEQLVFIDEIGFFAKIPAESSVIIPIAVIPDGRWQVNCGLAMNGKPIDEIVITVTSSPQPDAMSAPAGGASVIFSNEITLPSADAAIFFMANVALAADGSLGKQSFTGSTVVSASNQPLWFKRPRRLTSTLADGASTVIPAGTQVTIENAGKEPASVLLVGVAPAAAATANDEGPAPTPSSGSTDRPVTRDDDDGLGSLVSIARSIHTGADSSRRVLL